MERNLQHARNALLGSTGPRRDYGVVRRYGLGSEAALAAKAATSEIPAGQRAAAEPAPVSLPALTQGLALIRFS
jgi:hypothetical protein